MNHLANFSKAMPVFATSSRRRALPFPSAKQFDSARKNNTCTVLVYALFSSNRPNRFAAAFLINFEASLVNRQNMKSKTDILVIWTSALANYDKKCYNKEKGGFPKEYRVQVVTDVHTTVCPNVTKSEKTEKQQKTDRFVFYPDWRFIQP